MLEIGKTEGSRQNFWYTPELDEFAHICAITSPEAYRMLQREFPLRSLRSFQ